MFTQYDKAGAAAIGGALATIIGTAAGWDAEVIVSLTTVITAGLVALVPNKEA